MKQVLLQGISRATVQGREIGTILGMSALAMAAAGRGADPLLLLHLAAYHGPHVLHQHYHPQQLQQQQQEGGPQAWVAAMAAAVVVLVGVMGLCWRLQLRQKLYCRFANCCYLLRLCQVSTKHVPTGCLQPAACAAL
jgi:hypothetical protein